MQRNVIAHLTTLATAVILAVAGFPILPATATTAAAAQDIQVTTWRGTLNAGGNRLRLEVRLTRTGSEVSGTLVSLDQNNATMDLADIRMEGDTLGFTVPTVGASFSGAYTSNRSSADGTFAQGGAQMPVTFELANGSEPWDENTAAHSEEDGTLLEAWVGEISIGGMRPVMQFRIVEQPGGDTVGFFDSVTEGRTGFAATFSNTGDSLRFDVAEISLTYRGALNAAGDSAEGIWSQGGRALPLVLGKQGGAHESPHVWENRPQRPVAPFPYDEEEVRFDNEVDDVTLAGTLTIPHAPGRHPVAVLISGSGAQDRDETLMGHKPFLVLADYLSRRGIAVLRYDDRGTAESTGDFSAATTEDFGRDASAAVEFLLHHDRINPEQIGLIGHSEGGLVAPMVNGLRDDLAFMVLMGATGVDGITIIRSQTEAMLRAEGTDSSEVELAMSVNSAVMDVVMATPPVDNMRLALDSVLTPIIETLPEEDREEAATMMFQNIRANLPQLQTPWMQFFLRYDPRPALRNITIPVLAVTGSKDLQVLPDLNLPEIRTALREAGNSDATVIELDGLNHLFQQAGTGAISEYARIDETFNPAALATIADWIVQRTGS